MFKPVSSNVVATNDFALTLYKNRIAMNAKMREELGIRDGGDIYIYFDEESKRIGVSKICGDPNVVPFRFDKRGYAPATQFVKSYRIRISEKSSPYLFEGIEGDIYAFRSTGRIDIKVNVSTDGTVERKYRGDKANRR